MAASCTCFKCSFNFSRLLRNFSGQIRHLKLFVSFFVLRCVLRCVFMLYLWENFWPHISHSYGRSPVWDLLCRVICDDDLQKSKTSQISVVKTINFLRINTQNTWIQSHKYHTFWNARQGAFSCACYTMPNGWIAFRICDTRINCKMDSENLACIQL